jgi:hypothetical protein
LFNKKVGSILNLIRKVSLSILPTTFQITKKKKKNAYSTKEIKGIKINLDLIFNNFPVHRTGLRLVVTIMQDSISIIKEMNIHNKSKKDSWSPSTKSIPFSI